MSTLKNLGVKKSGATESARSRPSPAAAKPSIPVKHGGGMSGKMGVRGAGKALSRQSAGRDGN